MRAFFLMQKTLKTKPAPFSIRPCSSFTAPLGRLETASASALRQHLLAPRFLDRLSQSAPCSSEDCEVRAKSWSELGDFSLGSKGISGGTSVLVLMLTLLVTLTQRLLNLNLLPMHIGEEMKKDQ